MAVFVDGLKHDIFISYAHVDSCEVRDIREALERRLAQLLGRRDFFDVWIDLEMERTKSLEVQIEEALRRTATMVVMLSNGYLASDWCNHERATFLKTIKESGYDEGRIFVVHCDHVHEDDRPPEIAPLLGYKFCDAENEISYRWQIDGEGDRKRYARQIDKLAHDISRRLRTLRDEDLPSERQPAIPSSPVIATPENGEDRKPIENISPQPIRSRGKIFLAQAGNDVYKVREKLKARFQQAGLDVVPHGRRYSPDPDLFREQVAADMKGSTAFVQVLSPYPMPIDPTDDSSESYAGFQCRHATELDLPVFQWRDPKLTADAIEKEIDSQRHQELLLGTTVQAVELADFAFNIEESLRPAPVFSKEDEKPMARSFVFVNSAPKDDELVKKIGDFLDRHEIAWQSRLHQGKPSELREDFEGNVSICDGMVVVYGTGTVPWVRGQLRDTLKLLKTQHSASKQLALVEGPPLPKTRIGSNVPDMLMVPFDGECNVSQLRPFVEKLLGEQQPVADRVHRRTEVN